MNQMRYKIMLRIVAAVIAMMLWTISVYFSQDGFSIAVPNLAWVGWVLALCVTGIEMIWNSEGFSHNITILVVGIAAYVYGIWTNVIGVLGAQGNELSFSNLEHLIFPVILGIFLEITPEPLLVWAVVGFGAEDLLSHLFGGNQPVRGNREVAYPIRRHQERPTRLDIEGERSLDGVEFQHPRRSQNLPRS
jgi:hypothetical protein